LSKRINIVLPEATVRTVDRMVRPGQRTASSTRPDGGALQLRPEGFDAAIRHVVLHGIEN